MRGRDPTKHISMLKKGFWEYIGVKIAAGEYLPMTDRSQIFSRFSCNFE
jgi:hypothetical protein